jgi:nicotinamidase-related amidase
MDGETMTAETRQANEKMALLVIDVQRGLFKQAKGIYQAEQLLDNLNYLISTARQAGTPVIFIQHENEKLLQRGSDAWQLHPRIQPLESEEIIHKQHGNAFENTPLRQELDNLGVETLVICGLVTHGCVKATCLGALELGYHTILVGDGHSSYSKDADKLIKKWNGILAGKGAKVVEMVEVVW